MRKTNTFSRVMGGKRRGLTQDSVCHPIVFCILSFWVIQSFLQESLVESGCSALYALKAAVRTKENTSFIFCCRHVCTREEAASSGADYGRSSLGRFQLRKGVRERHSENTWKM